MKKSKLLSFTLTIALLFLSVSFFSSVAMGAPQTLTILGAQGSPGQTDPYTEFSTDNGQTWSQAFLYGWHPWGFISGTNSWLNIGPSGTQYGLYQSVLYRVRFNIPVDAVNPQMTFEVKADNFATVWLNDVYVMDIEGAGGTDSDATINGAVHPGLNEIKLLVTDVGGWAGFNYKITLNIESQTPPTLIDTTVPTASVNYSKVELTKDNVVATITPSESVTITNNNGSDSYIFSENGSFTFEFVDAQGNIGSTVATVANIDKVAPTATVAYNKTAPTNQNVVATITPSENVTVTNNGGSTSYTFTSNGSFTFNFVDAAGNTGSKTATVANIDKVAPTATVAYDTTAPTNQDVVATITPSEPVTVTNNGGSTSYTFTSNGSFTFNFVDAAGNPGSTTATVANIDKVAPTATVAYNTTAPTNQDVVATITPSESVTVTNNGGSTSYTFTGNGSFTFNFVDAAGNTGSITATVNNIDKVAPTLNITLNDNELNPPNHKMVNIHVNVTSQDNTPGSLSVVLTSITSNEPDNGLGDGDTANDIQGASFGTLDTDFQLRAERSGKGNGRIYTITYTITDAAGNQSTAVTTAIVRHDNSKK